VEVHEILKKCKIIARRAKAEYPVLFPTSHNFMDYFPPREVADKLVQNYFRTMEGTYRILHIPSFYREYESYWSDPQKVPISTTLKILLVMAIGTCFNQEADYNLLQTQAQQWVHLAQSWVLVPTEKGRLNSSGLQVQCLLLLARQTNAIDADMIWISAGCVLRTAFQMGLHRDPKHFRQASVMYGELRRRLWATVLEMAIQTSLDSGMPPLITMGDFDTLPPSNFNDEDISESISVVPIPKPANVSTQTSIQIQLLKSLPTRLQICQRLNSLHSELTYDEVLRLGTEMTLACKEATLAMKEHCQSLHHASTLQRNVLDMLVRRFLLAVHRPYAVKSYDDPRYYFSRKVCLDSALVMMTYSSSSIDERSPLPGYMDDYTRLKSVGGGFFKGISIYSSIIICGDLMLQLEEEHASGLSPSTSVKISHAPLQQCVRDIAALLKTRIELGENNIKEYLFLSAAVARIESWEKGTDPRKETAKAVLLSARESLEILKARTKLTDTLLDTGDGYSAGGEVAGELSLLDEDLSYDFVMEDGSPNFSFDIPESWLLPGWETSS
jgi:Fungal specific transcription factor domain